MTSAKDVQIVANAPPPKPVALAWAERVIQAAIERIIHDPGQPRRIFDPDGIRALANNIQRQGLLHPLHVRPWADDQLMIISGARRFEAVKLLEWTHVSAVIHAEPLTSRQLRLLQVSENHLREDVNPIEQALAFQDCLDGAPASQLAEELGIHVSTITRSIKLLDREYLPADLIERIRQGLLPGTIARELATKDLSDDTKLDLARRYLAKEFKNRSELTAAVRLARRGGSNDLQPESLSCEAAGVKLRLDLAAGQGVKEAEAALRELLADCKLHRAKTVSALRDFLAAKALTRKKAAEHQAAEAALGALTPNPIKESSDG